MPSSSRGTGEDPVHLVPVSIFLLGESPDGREEGPFLDWANLLGIPGPHPHPTWTKIASEPQLQKGLVVQSHCENHEKLERAEIIIVTDECPLNALEILNAMCW